MMLRLNEYFNTNFMERQSFNALAFQTTLSDDKEDLYHPNLRYKIGILLKVQYFSLEKSSLIKTLFVVLEIFFESEFAKHQNVKIQHFPGGINDTILDKVETLVAEKEIA